ncbi:hypothetical protein [Nocardioides sp.]|uniref:hypothetical protein n=1 Tax=Nocardioides sp. TaxID=35761 RepID=UPI00378410F1
MGLRHLASAASAAALVIGLSATAPAADAAASSRCAGPDLLRVKNVSCTEAKKVVWAALDHVGVDYSFTVRGFHCVFPGRDAANGISCHRNHKGKKQSIYWLGD